MGLNHKIIKRGNTNKVGYLLESESKKVGVLVKGRSRGEFEVLLLNVTSFWVLVTENEMHLLKRQGFSGDTGDQMIIQTLVPGQVKSGPNMTTQGVVSENSLPLVWKPSSKSFK